jgi:hypothetical protein
MKFTPEQVEQLLAESGANCVRSNRSKADEVYEAYFYELTRLCTLAADRALEAAAEACQAEKTTGPSNEASFYNGACVDCAYAIRAMKEQQ